VTKPGGLTKKQAGRFKVGISLQIALVFVCTTLRLLIARAKEAIGQKSL